MLGWADIKEPVCENPYKFSCGNFKNRYRNHELYLINKGEWGAQSNFEYEGSKLNIFRKLEFDILIFSRLKRSECFHLKTSELAEPFEYSTDD